MLSDAGHRESAQRPFAGFAEGRKKDCDGFGDIELMNSRNQSGDVKNRLLSVSKNAGESWEPVRVAMDLPDRKIDYQPRRGKRMLLFSTPNSQTSRTNLTVQVSADDGKSWSAGKPVYGGSSAYSDLVIQKDGSIGLV